MAHNSRLDRLFFDSLENKEEPESSIWLSNWVGTDDVREMEQILSDINSGKFKLIGNGLIKQD